MKKLDESNNMKSKVGMANLCVCSQLPPQADRTILAGFYVNSNFDVHVLVEFCASGYMKTSKWDKAKSL